MAAIVMYHSVVAEVEHPWLQIRPQTLAAQLDTVVELGYRWVSLEEAVRRPAASIAALTFDDGLADFLDAVEVLRARSVPATLYVCPGLVGATSAWASAPAQRTRPLLTADELRELAHGGVEIGCHGWTHTPFPELPRERLAAELRRAAAWFTDELGRPARSLAYPYGRCDVERAHLVGRFYDLALAAEPLAGVPRRLALPRLCGAEGLGREELAAQLARYDLARFLAAEG